MVPEDTAGQILNEKELLREYRLQPMQTQRQQPKVNEQRMWKKLKSRKHSILRERTWKRALLNMEEGRSVGAEGATAEES